MRVRPLLLSVLPAAALAAAGCGDAPRSANANGPPAVDPTTIEVGSPLYKAEAEVAVAAAPGGAAEPLIIPSVASFEERQQVSAEVDGKIVLLATRDDSLREGDPRLVYHPLEVEAAKKNPAIVPAKFRLLKEGDPVKAGQVVCWLDDQIVTTQMRAAENAKGAATEILASAGEGVKLTKEKLALTEKTMKGGASMMSEVLQDRITLTRFVENEANAKQSIVKAQSDFEQASVQYNKHRITSSVNGFVRTRNQHPGQFVKAGERILEIQATDTVRLEGNLDIQYAGLIRDRLEQARRGMKEFTVAVEPARTYPPKWAGNRHRQEVTGVAVTADPARPLVVTAGADGNVWVYDVVKAAVLGNLPHPVGVRAVACSPPDAGPALVVTGGLDGAVRVWDLSNPDKVPAEPKAVLADRHAAAVGAVAFSPDGKYLATAAGRDVFVWSAAEGKKLYALPADHRDAVTDLHFTPQATLVTASKDRTLKVWRLGADKAGLARTVDHRKGVVDKLGVTKDGGRVAFDVDKGRIDLVGLADRQPAGQVQNPGPTAAFGTLAVFNRDDSLLVTAGGEGELKGGLQVWAAPRLPSDAPDAVTTFANRGGRGTEAARLYTPDRAAVTAAAFSPSAKVPFLVVGTEQGTVYLWEPPADAKKRYTGRVVNVDSTDPRYVTVRVEMDNRELGLLDRSVATVIVNPSE